MKAAALVRPGIVELVDVAEPECGPDQVVVRVLGVGLCGSDLGVYSGSRPVPRTPWVLGHEGVGEIVEVGGRVRDRRVGQRVAIEPNYCCFDCPPCRSGFTSACVNRVVIGIGVPGLIAERVAVPAAFTFPVAEHVALVDLVCAEPLTVARAAIRRAGIAAGDSCLVVGTGSQGLFLCAALVALGVTPHVVEPHEGRRELAVSLGAVVADDAVRDVDFVFETSGVPAALPPALSRLAPGGTAVLIGISAQPLDLTLWTIVYRQLKLVGSLIYDHPADFAGTVAALEDGAVAPHRVLRPGFPLAAAPDAFAAVRSTAGKCWIDLTA
ncbi:zinc-dependent alcohol dehydrogenase [Saccharothrix deserti]|uniref:zinc-dependent alcohol dehydrogenase n=1 Tax=Saccharothrix deserti TaxID=2593674 RepID=UPI00131A671E|nr:alcohol dehydrogenase catalytic domain-containing protein [Saccharothrix deserti]